MYSLIIGERNWLLHPGVKKRETIDAIVIKLKEDLKVKRVGDLDMTS